MSRNADIATSSSQSSNAATWVSCSYRQTGSGLAFNLAFRKAGQVAGKRSTFPYGSAPLELDGEASFPVDGLESALTDHPRGISGLAQSRRDAHVVLSCRAGP